MGENWSDSPPKINSNVSVAILAAVVSSNSWALLSSKSAEHETAVLNITHPELIKGESVWERDGRLVMSSRRPTHLLTSASKFLSSKALRRERRRPKLRSCGSESPQVDSMRDRTVSNNRASVCLSILVP